MFRSIHQEMKITRISNTTSRLMALECIRYDQRCDLHSSIKDFLYIHTHRVWINLQHRHLQDYNWKSGTMDSVYQLYT